MAQDQFPTPPGPRKAYTSPEKPKIIFLDPAFERVRQHPYPKELDEGRAFDGSKGSKWVQDKEHGWLHSWTWRRSFDPSGNRSIYSVNVGDISQQNTGNDLDTAYLFPPLPIVVAEAQNGWRGGLNRTALRMLEDRAYGWFWNMRNISSHLDTSYTLFL